MKNDKTLHDWINKTITENDFEDFKNRPEYDELSQVWKATEGMQGPGFDKNAMLKEILENPKKSKEPPDAKTRRLPIWLPLLAAASFIIMLTVLFFPESNKVVIATSNTEQQTKELPDGSKLTLYKNSQLNYNASDWNKVRQLQLSGSAKFEVEKGVTFEVLTNYGQVEVLGTIFTVNTAKNKLVVNCSEGKIKVSDIHKNLQDEIGQNESITIINNESMLVYLTNEIRLREVSLQTVLNELQKAHGFTFETNKVDLKDSVTCKFNRKDGTLALEETLGNLNITYTTNSNVVNLSK